MEDCCAVCAEPLEWIGLGPCGHREVCFTCIARLRVVLNDKRCGICRQDCPTVLITKALGDFTRVITDWDALSNHRAVPGLGQLFYDKVVEAYFDDEEPFKIIKAMCRLYCTICEKSGGSEEPGATKGTMRKGYIFKNIDILRRHQTTVHKVHMCELCLEGRKVFICEQKLYSKSQLEQHASKGDSEVDGNEEERGGFAGHPMCAFCRKRFYGDNELYQHMSQEHYTCHMCQRARPGHYEYYRNYDDLEAHFRQEHSLCEHAECLAKKFVVFPSEAELKRHNATAHGGHMSRSQRNAALQIPVSFHYRRPGQDGSEDSSSSYSSRRSGRARGGHPYLANGRGEQLNAAVRASVESADLEEAVRESLVISSNGDNRAGASGPQRSVEAPNNDRIDQEGIASSPPPPQSSAQADIEHENSRYLAAVWGAGPTALGDAAFPPLPGASKNARRRAKAKSQGPASMAALLGGNGLGASGRGGIRVLNTAAADSRLSPGPSLQPQPVPPPGLVPEQVHRSTWPEGLSTQAQTGHPGNAIPPSNPPPSAIRGATGGASMNFGERFVAPQRELGAVGDRPRNQVAPLSMEDIRAANKALVERIRAGLEGNEQQFAAFKEVSSLFRKGEMSSADYYIHIARLGLSYVVPELARLCPDPKKGKELMDAHAAQLTTNNVVDPRSLLPGLAGAFSSTSSRPVTPTNAPPLSSSVSVGGNNSLWNNAFHSFPDLGGGGGSSGNSSWSNALQSSSGIVAGSSVSGSDYAVVAGRPVSAPNILGSPSRARADNDEVEVLSTDGYRRQKGKGRIMDCSSSSSSSLSGGGFHQVFMPSTEGTLFNDLVAARDRTPQVLVRAFPPLMSESSYAQPVVPAAVGAGAVSERPSTAGPGPGPRAEGVWACGMCTLENTATSVQCAACGTGKPGEEAKSVVDSLGGIEKRKKKTPKFQRLRLGEIAASGVLDSGAANSAWGQTPQMQNDTGNSTRSYGRGVWNNGGGQRLLSMAQRDSIIDDAWHGK